MRVYLLIANNEKFHDEVHLQSSPQMFHSQTRPTTHFPATASIKSLSDPQTYAQTECSRSYSRSNFYVHSGSCHTGHGLSKKLNEANVGPRMQQDISFLTEEIQKLTKENSQLKEDNCAKDFDYMTIIEQLDGKENEIEELRVELNQLSEQIALSNAKEEEYLNSARSCVSLENQIRVLQEKLAHHRRDFEQLSTVHAACPTPEELESAVEETKASYRKQITDVQDQLGERDQQIAALEDRIARKDVELQKLSSELIQSRSDCSMTHQRCGNLERRIAEMEHLIQDRERLIGNMKILMTRKSVKINLLLLRIRELEIKLKMCVQELRGAKGTRSSSPGYLHKDAEEIESLRKAWSQRTVRGCSKDRFSDPKLYDFGGGAGDAMGLWEELSTIQNSVERATGTTVGEVDGLLYKINNIKSKIQRKLEKEILRETEMTDLISSTRRHFDQTQMEVEHMRTHQDKSNESRELLRDHVTREMRLNQILDSSENEKQAINARMRSFSKALKNLDVLEDFLKKSRIL